MAHSQTYFQSAHHFEINNGQFMNIANATIINNDTKNDPVSTILGPHVAYGAIFDSGERYALGKCHPGTREKMIERISSWIHDPNPIQHVLWLYGPAGSGKSALAHTICELLKQTHPERYGGSFFFARGHTDRGKGLKFFTTLSYQLAVQFPFICTEINEALYRDPSLPTKSIEVQLFALIIQPLLRCRPFPSHSPTLIIDGLDECADDQGMDTQRNIIAFISQSIVEYNLPLRFIIASRPESWIQDAFKTLPLSSITLFFSLRDDIDADDGIRAYLTDEFERIRLENKRVMESVVLPWPPTHIVDHLVYEASGQYIYASTVLKFVGKSARFSDPQEQLRILTSPGLRRASAISELDRLYETIISAYPRWASMKRVLGGILAHVNSTIMEVILGVDSAEITLVLDALSPLIDIRRPGPLSEHELLLEPIFGSLLTGQDKISLCHLSFREFLEDEERSGAFHIHVGDIVEEITRAFFGIIHHNLDQKYDIEPHLSLNLGLAAYRNMMFVVAFESPWCSAIDTIFPLIIKMTQRLLLFDLDQEMKYFGYFMQDINLLDLFTLHLKQIIWEIPPNSTWEHIGPEKWNEFVNAVSELGNVAFLTWKRHTRRLPSPSKFQVTPTLVYLNEFHRVTEPTTIDELLTIPGHTIIDVLSTFQQHRHIINMRYDYGCRTWFISIADLNHMFYDNGVSEQDSIDEGWRTQGEWRHQRISLACQHLNTTLNKVYDQVNQYRYLGRFFNSHKLSDIHTEEYFRNPYNLSILALMTDFSAWTRLVPLQPKTWVEIGHFITPVLCWFNRQLTNPESLGLLKEHDKDLVPRMRTTMKQIFKHHFLQNFKGFYFSELYISTSHARTHAKSVRIRVLPLPQSHYREEETPYFPYESLYSDYWRPFHDEIFRKTPPVLQDIPSTINHLRWHPYLASRLLNALAKLLYSKFNPDFELTKREEMSKESFAYIVECLPYAKTTQQNLDALRAITYFFPKANLEWNPPVDFWFLSVEFLKKYDRSILSEEELNLFEWWMYSMGRYMRRYHGSGAPQETLNFGNWLIGEGKEQGLNSLSSQ